jgi:hypothetical protein
MIDDPVVQILREAAARGQQLRLAHERTAQNETRLDGDVSMAQLSGQTVGTVMTPQRGDNDVDQENSI